MIIQISEKERIEGTPEAWEIQKLVKNKRYDTEGNPLPKGEVCEAGIRWEAYRWYRTLRPAVAWLASREIRVSEGYGAADLEKTVSAVLSRYVDIFEAERALD